MSRFISLAAAALMLVFADPASAASTVVAVAANFTEPAKKIAAAFEKKTGDTVTLSFGSTGSLYTQVSQGAPYEVFLAADQARPKRAVEKGFAVKDSEFTYAVGALVLYSLKPGLVTGPEVLKAGRFSKLAIANPDTAPYGKAAIETISKLGISGTLSDKIVKGNNIAQAYQFVASGNADLGFVALSQVIKTKGGSRWIVPAKDHTPIRQDAVLLNTGKTNPAAKAFIDFLKGPEAAKIIKSYGYRPADGAASG
ncbi:molybdate ABC transporter substrate-binding protein [Jiella sp. MQZ9-1]|uniref:Molybdate ABC transporter substrate-binding protein n=1 Tax=Jiella flava TaxID=2816857 RepID=A0A939FZF6_9HYPH|nr:molybdate ABC transporter substrate-binding protein [Jiella flava]MBO0664332.1 molybdate ABC transporter substrate-binding protein [Jiella flava]MCD2472968.1 molybdate ABC transporter substrate-binding protein [Jiella flava]